jgi:uncharacterized protein YbjQ (UPF0145 family)
MSAPIVTSEGSTIRRYDVVEEIGPVAVVANVGSTMTVLGGNGCKFISRAHCLHALKEEVRALGGNGIIHVEYTRERGSGIAVNVCPPPGE